MIDGLVTRKSVWATNVILILRLKERNLRVGAPAHPRFLVAALLGMTIRCLGMLKRFLGVTKCCLAMSEHHWREISRD